MSWSVMWTAAIVFVVGVTCSPVDIPKPSSELLPPFEDSAPAFVPELIPDVKTPATDLVPPEEDNLPTLATDLMPPPIDGPKDMWSTPEVERNISATLFLINIYSVKNHTAEDSNDVLHDDVYQEVPDGVVEPLAMFLLVVEDKDEDHPVSLDEVARDLEAEGFVVEKIERDGATRLVKVDIGSVETMEKVDEKEQDMSNAIERVARELADSMQKDNVEDEQSESTTPVLEDSGKLMKIRRKRHTCLRCKMDEIKARKFHHGGGYGGCNGGCGGGGGYYPPVQYQPVQVVPVYRPQQQPYYPQPQPCQTCGQQHGGGGGSSYAQASAQASAQAQSW